MTNSIPILGLFGILLMLFSFSVLSPSHALSSDVSGDNQMAAYIGTGGLLLPESFSGSTDSRSQVASCLGCTWKYTIYCMQDSDSPCRHAVVSCPAGSLLYRVSFGLTPSTVSEIGSVCWGSSQPLTRELAQASVSDYVIRYVPALVPGFDPPDGTLTSIPGIFWTGQPSILVPPSFALSGRSVTITAKPTWRWDWGDGGAIWKSVPGAPYPSRQITHQFGASGDYQTQVTALWTATYTVSGVGTFEVLGELIR
ncbi:MAG: PKD domain-containing protein, partial [Actinomycetes bacterium]